MISNISIETQANVYFEGKCISYNVTLSDGKKISVGVILPAELTFGTKSPEIMQCTNGSCEYKLAGSSEWLYCNKGEQFTIERNSSFDIRVKEQFHYICQYG